MIIFPPLFFISDAIIAGGASLLGTAVNALSGIGSSQRQYDNTRKLMNLQNDLNVSNWNMQNSYNSPSAQISRLKSAGINPDLFYANGSQGIVNGTSPSVSLGSASMAPPLNSDFGQSTLSGLMLDSQKKVMDAQARKLNADAGQTEQTTPWVSEKLKSDIALNTENAYYLNESVEKIRSETELNKVLYSIQSNQNDITSALKDAQISASLLQLGATEKQSQVIIDNFSDLYTAQIKLAIAQAYASYVQSDASSSLASTASARLALDSIIQHEELSIKKFTAEFQKSIADSDIRSKDSYSESLRLQNLWRSDLVKNGKFGTALHNILSIPINALGGFFH